MRRFFLSALEILEVSLVALGAVFLIRTFLIQPFLVSGASMVPNFANGDYLLVDELSYYFRTPLRGEVIVFRYPGNESTYFIKRVIGLPGDRVVLRENKIVIYNSENPTGQELSEPYLPPRATTSPRTNRQTEFSVSPGQYLVLGDNRAFSFDSRDWGLLDQKDIVGVVRLRLWPLSGLTVFAAPEYTY